MKRIDIPLINMKNDIISNVNNKSGVNTSEFDLYINIDKLIEKSNNDIFTDGELKYIVNFYGERYIYNLLHNLSPYKYGYRIGVLCDYIWQNKSLHDRIFNKILNIPIGLVHENIATSMNMLCKNPDKYVALYDDLKNDFYTEINFPNLQFVYGDVSLHGLSKINGLPKLSHVSGDFKMFDLEDARGLENLQYIGRRTEFYKLTSAYGLDNLKVIDNDAYFPLLQDARGLDNLYMIGGSAHFKSLIKSTGLENLRYIGSAASFKNLTDISGLCNIETIGDLGPFSFYSLSENDLELIKRRIRK